MTLEDKKIAARRWVNGYTVAGTAVVVSAVIPGMTSAALVTMEGHMCYQIGKIYRGDNYTLREGIAVARVIGLIAVAAPLAAMEALNALPFAGWVVKGGIAGGVIKTLGEAIIAHYERLERKEASKAPIDTQPVIDVPSMKTITSGAVSPVESSPHNRLQKLNDLLEKKLISQTEFDAKRQQILSEL